METCPTSVQETLAASLLLSRIKALHLRTIPTACHVAPAPVMVLARIQKKPFATLRKASPHVGQLIRRQKLAGRTGDRPNHAVKVAQVVKGPFKTALQWAASGHQAHVRCGVLHVGIESAERTSRYRLLMNDRPKNV